MMSKAKLFAFAAAAAAVSFLAGCAPAGVASANKKHPALAPKKTLRPFGSEQELAGYFKRLAEERRREMAKRRAEAPATAGAANAEAASAAPAKAEAFTMSDARADSGEESVTNVQHAGVDEGGIVKVHGDHLVILRRGRLFTVAVGDGALRPVSATDAFAPDIDPSNTWYDEMLVSGDTVVVIGYSYERGGTEIGLFDLDRAGRISHRATYHLRSNDYYSSRNYSSRLIGDKLIFYTPLSLSPGEGEDPFAALPALRRWHKGAKDDEFKRIVAPTRVYRAERAPVSPYGMALHTVTVCDLARREMACEATAVVGAPGRVFYVSPGSVYVWASDWWYGAGERRPSLLYRMPLDGSAPSALTVSGSPVDQFSFLEGDDGRLNVLVRSEAKGDGMWAAEVAEGDVALLRVPLESFSDGADAAPREAYRRLPKPAGYTFQNRYVGEHLLYGTGSGWGPPEKSAGSKLYALRVAGGDVSELQLPHGVDRIEALGADALVVGTDGKDLHFTGVRLGDRPAIADRYTRRDAAQGELRSHGFFYKPDGDETGLLGLPVSGGARPGYEHLFEGSASVLFLRNDRLRLSEVGELASGRAGSAEDACRASCVDWYGNARPLFLRGRVFALLGYEIVEGALSDAHLRETRRVNFAPVRLQATRD